MPPARDRTSRFVGGPTLTGGRAPAAATGGAAATAEISAGWRSTSSYHSTCAASLCGDSPAVHGCTLVAGGGAQRRFRRSAPVSLPLVEIALAVRGARGKLPAMTCRAVLAKRFTAYSKLELAGWVRAKAYI